MKNITWAEERMEELENKGRSNWDENDWDAYFYIMQLWSECGYFDD